MLGDRVTCPVCGRQIGRPYLRRHQGSPTCLSYRAQGERANARLEEPAAKVKAQSQSFECPHCGYDYGPFARPFFERAKRRHLRLECASCLQRFVLKRDGSTYRVKLGDSKRRYT